MIEELITYLDPKKKDLDKYSRIAGGDSGLQKASELWETHAKLFEMICAVALHEWEANKEFNYEQLAAYKSGLAEVPAFLAKCAMIIESKKQKEAIDKK
jgi:hypothetical protein